ncbi:hypothetical protein N781_08830 [Pontibacillus halophilus JSM 076056 = DSM 19796]|uniref:Uncharacterized protein n=1 Tax=Pontibacillus halophilus JSM 076056 = DSM 19796 TaxID=1385510 RepID=A0A0A5GA16_9BACI|nr:hypothetical protein N781_08830 [Pontibacillus halophilus JSM 076056 = DSM 19796]
MYRSRGDEYYNKGFAHMSEPFIDYICVVRLMFNNAYLFQSLKLLKTELFAKFTRSLGYYEESLRNIIARNVNFILALTLGCFLY